METFCCHHLYKRVENWRMHYNMAVNSTVKTKYMFTSLEKETKMVDLNINEDKSKYMHVTQQQRRDRIE